MKVSIVIPTLNAGREFDSLLTAIARQSFDDRVEIVVVDSESDDDTRERARRCGAKVHTASRAEFNHGATRNLGIALSTGEFVVLLTQDAQPHDERWLCELLEPFGDPRVAGVYGRVIARPDATPLVARSVAADLVAGTIPRYAVLDDADRWQRLSPTERRFEAHFNDVSSCVRRSAFQEFGFPAISFGEDLAWGLRVLQSGRALVYQPSSVVEHSHASSLGGDFRRHVDDARLLRLLFEDRPGFIELARTLAAEVRRDLASLRDCSPTERLRHGAYSPFLRSSQMLGRLVGAHFASTEADRAALAAW